MLLGPHFTSFDIDLSTGITIHGVHSTSEPSTAEKPAILCLHGFPQNHLMWHRTAPVLSLKYRVIAIDLRGYGKSSKPNEKGEDKEHKLYAKSTMAKDAVEVMEKLGEKSFYLLSHDRGARVAHQLCVDFPEAVKKVIFMDISPTLTMFEATNFTFAKTYWHWFFLMQPYPFPETMLQSNPSLYTSAVFGGGALGSDKSAFHPEAVKSYEEMFKDADAVHGMCEDYRAGGSIDMEEQKRDISDGKNIKCDVLVLWGAKGLVEKMFHPIEDWQKICDGKVTGESVPSGHFIPEEAPNVVIKHALAFFQ